MEQNKGLPIIAMILIIFLSGCCNKKRSYFLLKMNASLKEQKMNFDKDYMRNGLLNHFPDNVKDNGLFLHTSPPSSPPSFKCSAQFGNIYLICKTDTTNTFIPNNALYKDQYLNDRNIIINLSELKRDIFPISKCNQWYAGKKPIPYFESFNFGLGEKEEKKIVDGEIYYNYIYTIPSDLQVYVIQAEAGNFWKESCNEARPESLKEWQNGYSRGIATSEKENMVVYWTMVW
ncbi:MAG: hypothetical protein WCR61_02930 [Bacteroidales bacterium]|nr:hypothetical protein [Bacteroidales bacterium]MDD4656645.1 hypothetical protein [Bacteroidales bacterium]